MVLHRLRNQIRGLDNHLIVGIDISKDRHDAFFRPPKGQSL
ncbi:transposase-related protein [Desulfosarcina variabilis str. Montpellier]